MILCLGRSVLHNAMVGHAGVHCTVLCLGRRVLVILCLGRSELHNAMLGAWACYIILFMGHVGLA